MTENAMVYVVDDDDAVRDSLVRLLKTVSIAARSFASPLKFLAALDPDRPGCILLDLRMPELNGIEVLSRLGKRVPPMPVLIITGYGSASAAIRAVKLGAVEFFEKPVNDDLLLERVQHWIDVDVKSWEELAHLQTVQGQLASLSMRERQVLDCIIAGMTNKEIARQLSISPKAIEIYRSHVMKKMESGTVVDLVLKVAGCLKCRGGLATTPPCLYPNELDRFDRQM